LEVGAKQRAPHLVGERAVTAWQLSDEGVAGDEGRTGHVECIELVMSETSDVHERASLPVDPGIGPPSADDVTTPTTETYENGWRRRGWDPQALAAKPTGSLGGRVRSRPGAEGRRTR
jgi:hypothetical protein